MDLEQIKERDWRSTGRRSVGRRSIWKRWFRREERQEMIFDSLVNSLLWECRTLSTTMVCTEIIDWLGAGNSSAWDDVVRGECCPRCILYLVYAIHSVNT
jgi:hypothetical protein